MITGKAPMQDDIEPLTVSELKRNVPYVMSPNDWGHIFIRATDDNMIEFTVTDGQVTACHWYDDQSNPTKRYLPYRGDFTVTWTPA